MFSRRGSRLSTMRVTRRIVLTLITKRSTILAVLKIKFGGFLNFVSGNAYLDQSRHEQEIREFQLFKYLHHEFLSHVYFNRDRRCQIQNFKDHQTLF